MTLWTKTELAALTGTVSANTDDTTLTGSSTLFTSEVKLGQRINVGGNTGPYTVTAIADDTHLTITPGLSGANVVANTIAITAQPRWVTPDQTVELVTTAEAQNSANIAVGKSTPGWSTIRNYTTNGGANQRRIVEPLVVFKS